MYMYYVYVYYYNNYLRQVKSETRLFILNPEGNKGPTI